MIDELVNCPCLSRLRSAIYHRHDRRRWSAAEQALWCTFFVRKLAPNIYFSRHNIVQKEFGANRKNIFLLLLFLSIYVAATAKRNLCQRPSFELGDMPRWEISCTACVWYFVSFSCAYLFIFLICVEGFYFCDEIEKQSEVAEGSELELTKTL